MASESDSSVQPTVERRRRRISSVWLVPIVALGLASWLLWKNRTDQGPLATVTFETAEGLAAGKSEVRCRSVRVGVVETIRLDPNLEGVGVDLRLDKSYDHLLRADSRFWVVRPRVSASSITGLGTLISGAYIELEPGESEVVRGKARYEGLETPPTTASNVPGLRLTLEADHGGSLSVGAPIYYRDFAVGKVEERILDTESQKIRFSVFINEEYASLVRANSRFWNTSGIDVSAGVDGFRFRTPSIQAIVTGGAGFFTPEDVPDAPPAPDGNHFVLHEDEESARQAEFVPDTRALLLFDQSVRGLRRGAPVEFRGIPFGKVVEVSFELGPRGDPRVPVLVDLDLAALRRTAKLPGGDDDVLQLDEAVANGLRASLATGSLLTGALYVELDLRPDEPLEPLAAVGGFPVIPTVTSGLVQLEAQVNDLLTKIETLPLEDTLMKFGNAADETATTLADSRDSLDELRQTLADVRGYLAADATRELPENLNETLAELRQSVESLGPKGAVQGDLRRTLDELRASLRAFTTLSNSVEEEPNSLIFGRKQAKDPVPRANP